MGVVRERVRAGRPGGAGAFPTGLTLGDGGMASARPRRGVRGPERLPGIAGRRRGTGADILGTDDPCDGNSRVGGCGCIVEHNRKRSAKGKKKKKKKVGPFTFKI